MLVLADKCCQCSGTRVEVLNCLGTLSAYMRHIEVKISKIRDRSITCLLETFAYEGSNLKTNGKKVEIKLINWKLCVQHRVTFTQTLKF